MQSEGSSPSQGPRGLWGSFKDTDVEGLSACQSMFLGTHSWGRKVGSRAQWVGSETPATIQPELVNFSWFSLWGVQRALLLDRDNSRGLLPAEVKCHLMASLRPSPGTLLRKSQSITHRPTDMLASRRRKDTSRPG